MIMMILFTENIILIQRNISFPQNDIVLGIFFFYEYLSTC